MGFCLGAPLIGFAIALGVCDGCKHIDMYWDSPRPLSLRSMRFSTGRNSSWLLGKRGSSSAACWALWLFLYSSCVSLSNKHGIAFCLKKIEPHRRCLPASADRRTSLRVGLHADAVEASR